MCATTRAVHLEVVDNLSAKSFILCLRRLAAAKGIPSTILSDNHKTFISGEKFLLDLQEDIIKEFLQDHRITWRHQTPCSPWMGGHFKRLVRTIKTSLSAAMARKLNNQEEFTTIVKEVVYSQRASSHLPVKRHLRSAAYAFSAPLGERPLHHAPTTAAQHRR